MDGLELFHGPNAGYALDVYDTYLRDPESIDPQMRALFDLVLTPCSPWSAAPAANGPTAMAAPPAALSAASLPATTGTGEGEYSSEPARPDRVQISSPTTLQDSSPTTLQVSSAATAPVAPSVDLTTISNAARLARNLRGRGHLAARLDPLGSEPAGDPGLTAEHYGLSAESLAALPAGVVGGPAAEGARNACEAIARLRAIYETTTGYDYNHVQAAEERTWIRDAVESGRFHAPFSAEQQCALLDRLTQVEAFERFLHTAFQGQKRFSIEGTDMLVPMLDEVIRNAVGHGAREVVMGMAHRGRLNVLAHVLEKPYERIFTEFREASLGGNAAPSEGGIDHGRSDDVKYHLGAIGARRGDHAVSVTLTLASNPSHLEFINPVVEGMTRAAQDRRDRGGPPAHDDSTVLPILIHGDAAFPGEGVVAETLNLSRLEGYRTGGTVHIILNNQVGFTTEPRAARSTLYASDLAKGFEIPIIHVNADDVAACIGAARLAYAYRAHFHKDILIDLVGYRRWGHNEGDEPAFTQPRLYEQIASHPTVRALWAQQLDRAGIVPLAESENLLKDSIARLREINVRQAAVPPADAHGDHHAAISDSSEAVVTAVSDERLRGYNEALLRWPDGFAPHQRLTRQLERRHTALDPDGAIDWGFAETLAFASILDDATPIRLTGQDTERGTFGQRNLVLHDTRTGATFTPLQALPEVHASFAVYNSPLSEAGALGFEYGYSVHAPETLVLWEAQYGDFANAGQVVIDQFIAAARAKWQQHSSLVLLLPHGYEGQGPEHSNARLERFLQLAAQDNMWVVNPSTAAQYFHLLRRHAALLQTDPRPLIVMAPKSLLRHPRAASRLQDLTQGSFRPVLDDLDAQTWRDEVSRLVLCSGKVYIDMVSNERREQTPGMAIARVEQLYPFPGEALAAVLDGYPRLRELMWLQEEPQNMGAWPYMAQRLHTLAGGHDISLTYIGRSERASPAVGSARRHAVEQASIVADAFAGVRTRHAEVQRT